MSQFLTITANPTQIRVFGAEERWNGDYGPRYGRLCINRATREVCIFAYSYPVWKILRDLKRGHDKPPSDTDCDIEVSVTGQGKGRIYVIEPVDGTPLTQADYAMMDSNKLSVKDAVKQK